MCDKKKVLKILVLLLLSSSWNAVAELKDPTEPAEYKPETHKEEENTHYILHAVFITGSSKLTIINNRILKVGDKIGDAKVKSIEPYRVVLSGLNGEITLHLFSSSIKEPSK